MLRIAAVILLCCGLCTTATAQSLGSWGGSGNGPGKFFAPEGIAVDPGGFVYVLDTGNSRVQKFTANGDFVTMWGSDGDQDGQFNSPAGIATDAFGHVFVADSYNHRIQKFAADGTFLLKWGSCCQADTGKFDLPFGIDVDTQGHVFVVDSGHQRVEKFTNDGVYMMEWTGPHSLGLGQLHGLCVDPQGFVYLGELNVSLIHKYSGDGALLETWSGWGPGCSRGRIGFPYNLTADASSLIYDADGCDVIQKFDDNGVSFGYWGAEGTDTTQFTGLKDVAAGPNGVIYTVESTLNRVQMFGPGSVPALPTTWGRLKARYR